MARDHTKHLARQLVWERNILATFELATPSQIVDGKRWYPEAIKALDDACMGVWDIETRAAVCAMLSPRITWTQNVINVRKIARAVSQGLRVPPVMAGLNRNINKAWDTANDGDLFRVSGPKVSAFYANLCGNFQRVTLDVWAARAAGLTDEVMNHIDRNRYVYLERAYQAVAAELGFAPAELQAICWIVVRGKGE